MKNFKRYLCKVGFVAALLLGVMNSSVALNKFCRQGQSVRLSLEREREEIKIWACCGSTRPLE